MQNPDHVFPPLLFVDWHHWWILIPAHRKFHVKFHFILELNIWSASEMLWVFSFHSSVKNKALFPATNKCKVSSNYVQNALRILLSFPMFKENKEAIHFSFRLHRVMLCSVLAHLCKNMPVSINGMSKRVSKATRTKKMHNIYLKGGLSLVCIQRLMKSNGINSQWGPLDLKPF